jgi:glucose/mannose-6-phosphate isomerase
VSDSATADLSVEAVAAVDTTGQLGDIVSLPEHLRDALWRFDSAAPQAVDARGGLVIAGMGGSAVGGLLAAAAIGDRATRPIVNVRDYTLPGWVGPGTLVLCSSYSGDTEETLAAYDAAAERGAPRLVATIGGALAERARRDGVPVVPIPGGFQPRAAVGYALVTALEAAALCGAAPSLRGEVEAAADHAERLGGAEWEAPRELARELAGRLPVVYGAGLTAPVAYRWKTQINENASVPAFSAELPEADHNEIVGWEAPENLAAFFLDDPATHERTRLRVALTAEETGGRVLASDAPTRTARLVELVHLGDLASLYLAVLRGVDPADIAPIDRLKAKLSRS